MNAAAAAVELLTGIPVHISDRLPLYPSDGAIARRIVRHGLADVLAWWGEEPGPDPLEPTHAMLTTDLIGARTLVCSPEYADRLRAYGVHSVAAPVPVP